MARKKKMISEKVTQLSVYEMDDSFESIEKMFQGIREEFPQYESFTLDHDYEYDYGDTERRVYFIVYGHRPETAKDRRSAAAKRAQEARAAKAHRLAQYNKLKAEFGD